MLKTSVVSTFTKDTLVKSNKVIAVRPGGPAYFIKNVLDESGIESELFCGEQLDVEIKLTDNGEYGRIVSNPKKQSTSELKLSDWTIISTVLDEWILSDDNIPPYLFLDLQGYVRSAGKSYGKKHLWEEILQIKKDIYCIKGTNNEIQYLPKDFVDQQKQKMLVITDGSNGSTVYFGGKSQHVNAENLTGLPDTIGAGDTYLTHFAISFMIDRDPLKAAEVATNKTAEYLKTKLHN